MEVTAGPMGPDRIMADATSEASDPWSHGHVGTLTQEGGDKQRYANQAGLILFLTIL